MKKETIIRFVEETNWNMNKEQYDSLTELSGDINSRGGYFTKDIVEGMFEDDSDIIKLLQDVDFELIKGELLVRMLLDGCVEDEMLG